MQRAKRRANFQVRSLNGALLPRKRPNLEVRSTFEFILSLVLLIGAVANAADFNKDIRPLLEKHCVECHGADKQKADLRLDTKTHAFKGSESGPVIIAKDSAKSLLYQRIISLDDDERMPPKGERLSEAQAKSIQDWIDTGAVWPESEAEKAASEDKRLKHWSYQPLKRPTNGTCIDDFVSAKIATEHLSLSAAADARTLIRRVYFDVTGLPPTYEQVTDFVNGKGDGYEKTVDQLLASPRFGERWARHWLDVVRFAESDGFEMNRARANAWPYRDYVIESFNKDKPYDQFVREQLAGDAFGVDAATGFLVGGPFDMVKSSDPVLTANQRADELHDMVSTTSAAFLGLTLNCARCHDHKFDPIPTRDYYSVMASLQGVRHGERALRNASTEADEKKVAELKLKLSPIEAELAKFQPLAQLNHVLLIDDSAAPASATKAGVTQIEQPKSGQPILYSPGKERGQASDPGDVARLPNLGESYRYWNGEPGKHEDVFTWSPHLSGRHRVWVSWATWTTHTKDAHYVLDRDGDLATKDDQVELGSINQSQFADGSPAIDKEKRWSGFKSVGEHELLPQSVVILRTGDKGGPHVADVMAFEEVLSAEKAGLQPALRAPVSHLENEERFNPVRAKYLRFTITETSGGEPCIDELEVFRAASNSPNLARAAKATASGTYMNGANAIHQLAHINDGKYGNEKSWISNQKGEGWLQLEFNQPQDIARVGWSRDRRVGKNQRAFEDRLAIGYRIEVSMNGNDWTSVASSSDRLSKEYRKRISTLPTLTHVPVDMADKVGALSKQRNELNSKIAELSKSAMAYAGKFEQPGPTHRNHRGDPMQPREEVQPGALSMIGQPLIVPENATEQERRVALGNWIASKDNPLAARVIVNRLWHYHFGTGLVDTPSDFGINGAKPTHPELLDFLASELIANNWSLKHIHRLILNSKAYKQSSAMNEVAFKADSNARLLWRFPPRRLEAEPLRDAMLSVSGQLDLKMGGPGFDLFEPNDNYVKVYVTRAEYGSAEFRRMIYQSKPRTMLDDFFGAFDCPDAGQPQPKRTSSTTPLQALNLLNSNFALQQSKFFAERAEHEAGNDLTKQVQRCFQLIFQREAATEEVAGAVALAKSHGLPALCRALYNSNEFIRLN